MKPFNTPLILPLLAALSLPGPAGAQNDVDLDNITMDVVRPEQARRGHRLPLPAREIIIEYMLENGDITAEQIERRIAARNQLREELQTLRDSGDPEAYSARIAEIQAQGQLRREDIRAYIEDNDELREALIDELSQNAELREKVLERREKNRETRTRIREKLREARDEASEGSDG